MTENDPEAFLAKAIQGDKHAMGRLLLAHQDRLIRVIARDLPTEVARSVSAEDVAQQAAVDAIRGIAKFKPQGPGAFWPWLRAIAKHRLQTIIRAHHAEKRGGKGVVVELPPQGQAGRDDESHIRELLEIVAVHERTPSRSAARHEAIRRVCLAVEALTPDYREAIHLHYIQGMSIAELAARMGRTPGAVQMLCNRGLRALAKSMGSSSHFLSGSE